MSTRPCLEPLDDRALLGDGAEARQALDADRPVGEAVGEGLRVLLGEQRRRHQHGDLAPAGDGRERRAQRDFRLAEADVAADDAVHRASGAHVREHGLDRLVLVDRLLERECGFEGAIGVLVEGDRASLARRAARVEVEQLRRDVAHALRGAPPRARPLLGAELVPGRRIGRAAGVARDETERVHRHVQQVAARVLDDEELGGIAGDLHDLQAAVAADAVFLVHHRGAGRERGEFAQDRLRVALDAPPPALLASAFPEELVLGDERERARRAGAGRARRTRRRGRARGRLRANDGQSAATSAARPWRRSMSSRTSRRPAESAVTRTRPSNAGDEALELVERALRRAYRPAGQAAGRTRNSRMPSRRRSVRP